MLVNGVSSNDLVMYKILVLGLLGLLHSGVGQIIQNSTCNRDFQPDDRFDYEEFLGTWYELHVSDERSTDCSYYNFARLGTNNDSYTVTRNGVNENFEEVLVGTGLTVNGTGRLSLNWATSSDPVDFWVSLIFTTATPAFAVTFSCVDIAPEQRSISFWVLSKDTAPLSPSFTDFINTHLITTFGVGLQDLRAVSHNDRECYILPPIEPGNPIVLPGQCDLTLSVVQNFNVTNFAGVWHEIASYSSNNSENQCSRAQYTLAGSDVNIVNSQVLDQTLATITGTAVVSSTDGSARLNVTLNVEGGVAEQDLWVLATDYSSYAISYTCINQPNNTHLVYSWILGRTRQLSAAAQAAVNEKIASEVVLNSQYYQDADQSDDACFFYPEPVPDVPVVFRGSCNSSIPVVENFNATAYMGTWHDIESYPSVFQTGTCKNANYALGDAVDVLNTQVIGQTLDVIRGVAVLATNDSSAKLSVSFPIAGLNTTTTTDYWVLSTDYTSYALVYTCNDLPETEERQVWAWKLSRTKTLSPAAALVINDTLESIPVLDQRYFVPVDQSPDGCFYYPEAQLGVPVVFPGQCDDDIVGVVQNFNLSQFEGVWHEVEAYPKDEQQGNCISHQYTNNGNTLALQSYQVTDRYRTVTNGTLAFSNSTDSSARLTITLDSGIEIPFWILNTDYDDYALAYSCVDRGDDFRAIYSWKLSRTPQLSPNGISAINNAMTGVQVLRQDYYELTDHSDEACFYLPELAAGEPVILVGQCDPNITVVANFNASRYLGRWRLIESYQSDFQSGSCNEATYTLNDESNVDVYNTQVINDTLYTINGIATVEDNGKLLVYFPDTETPSEYWILDTDYDSFALVYSCRNLNNETRQIWSWKMSRTRSLPPQAEAAINQQIANINVLFQPYYWEIDQTAQGCFFFPELEPSTPVTFRGTCDQSIDAVDNFNVTRYLGLWHNIELYPSVFQGGSCNNAYYSLGAEGVDVYNTQVLNETLDTMTGLAVVAPSSNGTGKLIVSFPIAGSNSTTSTNYWILDTDYESYSLVYTCVDLEDERRLVYSWKLSRTKELTPAAVQAINNRTSDIQVLDDRYYRKVDQSPDGCFYYPEAQLGVPVVFPGQCDDDIVGVVQNFNLSRFEGVWHEVEAYPKDEQQGNCISHQYTNNGNTLALQSYQVTDRYRTVTNGTLAFSNSTDSSARLTITLDSGIEIPFWILNTDYDDYALAYSCVDRGDDFRAIYSWKLSRTPQLSPNGISAINNAMTGVQVLRQDYYELIDHSDEACFYLPELAAGEPVILVGQCDPNITVVANFNASRYLGRWRLIESYQSDFQSGSCNEATYTLNDESNVDVYNTQVINDTLYTINGLATVEDNGKLLVYFPDTETPSEYWILDTDYDSFALVYSCRNLNNETRQIWSWKMSRTRSLPPQAEAAINQQIATINVLFQPYYWEIDQTTQGCFFFPELEPSTPVTFRGTCDQSIDAVDNFNVTRYLGLWHNIELYPSVFQGGSCNNAYYSLGAEGVDVYNTQVLNETLDTMTGLAVVAPSSNGTGKLIVSFPIAGSNSTTSTNYWILDTDYESYSLVYSCVDLEDEQRLVYSWKLSRTKELTPAAVQAINNRTSDIQVLDDRYYRKVDQSPAGCFYYPDPEPGRPVVFPGQCDNTINATSNFNLTRFEGVWYEIQAYPKDLVQGQCASHEYSANTETSLALRSLRVYDQSLIVSNGTLSLNSDESSAKMTININVFGSVINIPFWILSTDYDDYALAYSCVNNLDDDARAVYSWKLSRSQELSAYASAAINQAITAVDVLQERYYENVNQSDVACFYLPDLEPGEPIVFPGQCDSNITVVQNFSAADYLGRWRLVESYPSDFQSGSCNQATYSLKANGAVDVFNTQVINETLYTITGEAVVASVDGSGKLLVTFPNATSPTEYWILDTDYTSYSLVYSCENLANNRRRIWSWKLSRNETLTEIADDQINQKIYTVEVLNNRFYEPIAQTDEACFYFPEPEPSTPVKLRGRCEDIDVERNFNPERYSGLWHNIELYPSVFQGGTCNNAYYSLTAGGVNVFNSQVLDQTLDTMTGFAVAAATSNGTGKLEVTFPVAGTNLTVTLNYWIIATDYESYSLVYTCDEIDDEYKLVYSWKLSRTKQLTPNAEVAINNRISSIQDLDERYYNRVDQTPDGCFYFPEPQPGVPVVFPGSCDNNIPVVQNFNLNAFEGIWYELQAYPKDEQQGQCINHEYSTGPENSLLLQSSHVYNEALGINYGTLNFTSSDNSAKMTITITVNGTAINIPFWILDIDYEDYALAYSCVDQENDYRAVYSWKLSRNSTTLSAAANANINNIVSTIDVLGERYFETIDQSDEACFHLPDLAPGAPVVFPGQCDESIPAVANFDPTRYVGRWRTIETYQSEFQGGTCGQAVYSLTDDGATVNVYNTQVINETLDTMSGSAVVTSTDGTGKLLVNFPTTPEDAIYWILATDYDSYALVYSCRNLNTVQRQVWAWTLSRDRELSQNATSEINAVINNINVLNDRYFVNVPQTQEACFYYPEPNGQPVQFRGQCNEDIAVVQSFDVENYAGVWYDIESYPQSFQGGTCPTATYTLSGDVVNVSNTQVLNQQLDTISAVAVPSSNDGSAKLNVTFPVAGTNLYVTTPYWVLATDYSNYSLVYSCENVDDEYYRVTSWKLSKSRELSAESWEAIANATRAVAELRDLYYEPNGHTEGDCFYYPDNNGGPVIQYGQCDATDLVEVVTNFNASRFAGAWYEINRFPSELQIGSCVASQFDFNQNSFDITKTIVYDERITAFTGRATLSDISRGVLAVDLNDGNSNSIAGEVFILDTDYDEYALLYSCRNRGTDRKQVYSWKLSRIQTGLTPSAIASIESVVTNRTYLFENYYERTGQDDNSCFHYPQFGGSQSSIILPGACDERIRGVANFRAADYLREWYEIYSYPDPNQLGECARANYAVGNDLSIINTQVVNRTLLSQEGSAVVTSTDGSGQLLVTFVVNGETRTANYYVLATDYDNYALVYSCRNIISANSREVFSWKLSRSNSLSPAADNAMNSVITTTQGLLNDYYEPTSQATEDCFYVPEFSPDESVIFRGRCSAFAPFFENFQPQRYLNKWWHEIERYPSDSNGGECVSTRYQASDNTFVDLRIFGINDGRETTGTVTAGANGQIVKTFSDGTTETLWVVATDYDTYALLLSCEDVGDEYIRVWSTKHSSTRSLTPQAEALLAPVIEANDLLYPQFFQNVSQSDASCFYYPQQDGQRIILPGQCDENIPTQANFDLVAYVGTWYQIERYPYPEVRADSTCIGTRYTLRDSDNVVDVLNWETNDDDLQTISGVGTWTNGSAIITVALQTDPEDEEATSTTDLYVLITDYVTYSLAYTCKNLDGYHRVVVALKLSRTRGMPQTATTSINNYMLSRQELNQAYFLTVAHDEDCEDPSSSVLVKSSIVVILFCLVIQTLM